MPPLLFVEEPRRADVAGEHEEADDADQDGEAALDEEDNLPPVQQIALHAHQAVGDQPREGAGDGVHAREETHAEAEGELRVHERHVVEGCLGEAGLGGTKQQAQRDEVVGGRDAGVAHAEGAPSNQGAGEPDARAETATEEDHDGLEGDIGGGELWMEVRMLTLWCGG